MSYYLEYFALIVRNAEQYCGFGSSLPRRITYYLRRV